MNVLTAFVDASQVYGSSLEENHKLRSSVDGKLLLDDARSLPLITMDFDGEEPQCLKPEQSKRPERTAGDVRARDMPGLASMHTLFARGHNRIANAVKNFYPDVETDWTDEDSFQNARRILIAEWQKIVYNDWLPIIMGKKGMKYWGLKVKKTKKSYYDPLVDPSIRNSFATAAFRFGHTLIQGLANMHTALKTLTKYVITLWVRISLR